MKHLNNISSFFFFAKVAFELLIVLEVLISVHGKHQKKGKLNSSQKFNNILLVLVVSGLPDGKVWYIYPFLRSI